MTEALHCPAVFAGKHKPVLFVHGTTLTADSNWAWNYGRTLPGLGYDVCLVDLPDRARADIQLSSEYAVQRHPASWPRGRRARSTASASARDPSSPGGPSNSGPTRGDLVGDLVAMSGAAHGFTETEVICSSTCIAPFWQMKAGSRFLKFLNSDDETPGDIAYTSVYSRTDQFVWRVPNGPNEPWAESAKIEGTSNIAIQDICPGRPVEHVQATYDAAMYAVVMDALTHDGPADASGSKRASAPRRQCPAWTWTRRWPRRPRSTTT